MLNVKVIPLPAFSQSMGHKYTKQLHLSEVLHKAIGGIEIFIEIKLQKRIKSFNCYDWWKVNPCTFTE